MRSIKPIHVVPYGSIWAIRKAGYIRIMKKFRTKAMAIKAARQYGVQVIIQPRTVKYDWV